MITKLTQAKVNSYKIPDNVAARKQELVDEGGTGLYLNVSYTGIKTFMFRYRSAQNGNKTTHVKLGLASDITLSQARHKVKTLRAEIALGDGPQEKIKKQRQTMDYDTYMMNHYFPYTDSRLRSSKELRRMYSHHIKRRFGHVKLNMIKRSDVQIFHDELLNIHGYSKAYCNRHLALIKASYNVLTNVLELSDVRNPVVGIKLFPEENRTRYLNESELSRLLPILISDDSQQAKIIRFLLATGLRLNECLHAKYEDIDRENRVMTIPTERSKSRKVASIPLNQVALDVLDECDKSTPYPFANLKTGKPFVCIKKRFQKLMKMANLEGVSAHTLRHTTASALIQGGRTLYEVQKILRHSSPIVTEKYSHLSQATIMAASDTVSDQLMKAANGCSK